MSNPIRPIPDRIEHLGSDLSGILRATGDGQPPTVVEPSHDLAIDGNRLGLNYPELGLINPARTPIYETCYRPVSQPTSMLGQPASRGGTWDHYLSHGTPYRSIRADWMPAGHVEIGGGEYVADRPGMERFYLNSLPVTGLRRVEAALGRATQSHWGMLVCLAYLDTHNHVYLRVANGPYRVWVTIDGETTEADVGGTGPGQTARSVDICHVFVEVRSKTSVQPVILYGTVGSAPSEWSMPTEVYDVFFAAGVQAKVGVGGWAVTIRVKGFRCDLI